MKYKHIIWDWNGTLLNDRWLCIESINSLLVDRNKAPLTEEQYLNKFDFPVRDYYVRAGFDFGKEDFKIPAIQFIDLYNKKRKDCRLQENALQALEYFKSKGISQSLLSASESRVLNDMVDHFDIRKYFTLVAGLNNHYAASKLDLGKNLLEEINLAPKDVLMVGDTRHDHEVADAMGVDIILYDQGHFPRHRLEGNNVRVISDLAELIM